MPPSNPEEQKKLNSARRLCELFRGRFSETVALELINDLGGELQAVDFVLNEKEDVVSRYLKKNPDYVEEMRSDSKRISDLLENGIEYEIRQFSCADCVSTWWKKVPVRKQVVKCRHCKTKYDPVPRENEWGWAKFTCPCSNEFHGFGEMGVTTSECYKCFFQVPVVRVLPPRRRIGTRKSKKPHSCNGFNCFGHSHNNDMNYDDDDYAALAATTAAMHISTQDCQNNSHHNTYNNVVMAASQAPKNKGRNGKKAPSQEPAENDESASSGASFSARDGQSAAATALAPVCIHPKSRQKSGRKIRTASKKHVSTGSTVDTFMTQGSLDTATVSMAFSLDSVDRMARIDE